MPRLGELLVAAGLCTPEQVEQALRAQVLWGGRLGTNLVELHYLELDPLSRVLGRQHHLPAAFARHFEKADPELQARLPVKVAERFSCLPLLHMGPDRHVVVAAVTPLTPRQLAIVADQLAVDVARLVPAIAAELRIRYQLERVYRIRRAARFLRARGASIPPFPSFQILPVHPDAELDLSPPSLPVSTREIEAYRPDPGAPARGPDRAPAPDPALTPDPAPQPVDEPVEILIPRTATDPNVAAALAALGPMPAVRGEGGYERVADGEHDGEDDDLLPVEIEVPAGPDDLADPVLEDDLAIASEPVEDEAQARERRGYVRTIADAAFADAAFADPAFADPASADPASADPASADPASDPDRQSIGRIAIRKVAVGSAPRVMAGATLGEATREIRCSTGRDRVADLVIDALDRFAPACEAAILLVIRGATAIGWKGFQRADGGLPEIAVPMDDAGLVPRAVELNVALQRTATELAPIDRLLLASLGRSDGDLAIVPIAIADQVMCVIAIATADSAPIACAESIAAAAGAAFARLMRDASR